MAALATNKDNLNDSLDALFDGVPSDNAVVREGVTAKGDAYETKYEEVCRKCRGTGRFVGFTGRVMGECFECKGAGKKTFSTSPEARAKGRASAANRKASKGEQNLRDFAAEYPDVWAWMDGSTFGFAVSMREAVYKWGSLTDGQMNAARNAITKLAAAKAEAAARIENAPVADVSKIEESFAKALSTGLKRPRMTIGGMTFSMAPATGKNAGALYVKSGGEYLGKFSGGKFYCSRDGEARKADVLEIAADPKGAAIRHGRLTGSCAICNRGLTNKASVELGIGPICAEKFGW